MKKFTQADITNTKDVDKFDLETIGLSFGVYGINVGLFQDRKTKDLYVVKSRSTNLFKLV